MAVSDPQGLMDSKARRAPRVRRAGREFLALPEPKDHKVTLDNQVFLARKEFLDLMASKDTRVCLALQVLTPLGHTVTPELKARRESPVSPTPRLVDKGEMARKDTQEIKVIRDGPALRAPRVPPGLGAPPTDLAGLEMLGLLDKKDSQASLDPEAPRAFRPATGTRERGASPVCLA